MNIHKNCQNIHKTSCQALTQDAKLQNCLIKNKSKSDIYIIFIIYNIDILIAKIAKNKVPKLLVTSSQ